MIKLSREKKEQYSRFSITLPKELLNEFDTILGKIRMSRSEAIRNAMRNFIESTKEQFKEGLEYKAGSITVIFDHDERFGLVDELTELQHHYNDIIDTSLHIHLDEKNCMMILPVRGKVERVNSILKELMAKKEIKQTKTVFISSLI